MKSYRLCILSWFRLHTETGNIWTHLIAFIATLIYLAYYMSLTIGDDIEFEMFFILFYFAAAINCWLFSGTGSLFDLPWPQNTQQRHFAVNLQWPQMTPKSLFPYISMSFTKGPETERVFGLFWYLSFFCQCLSSCNLLFIPVRHLVAIYLSQCSTYIVYWDTVPYQLGTL